MKRRRIGCLSTAGFAMLLIAAFAWWVFFSEFMMIDRCLDSGGRWSEGGSCEFEQPST
ncbi:MAG: hypothetical protein U1E18_27770 [Brevundimonas sp.]|uniref:hypothetical protein n=1 Tax=Brevundimonas sp. TaxID=1871086 RepID=UPI002AB915C2|nr:hypothetical protein [Brevundimonas sp.]MDZ4113370.1 hypothetical protein [Brevundimonas sp.]